VSTPTIVAARPGATPLLSIRDLTVSFEVPAGRFTAVRGFSLDVAPGETVAVVGESGSGKSTMAATINGLLASNGRVDAGSVLFEGIDVTRASEKQLRAIRGAGIGLVPQDPMSNLDPIRSVGSQIAEALREHRDLDRSGLKRESIALLDMVGIPEPARRYGQFPHELSGGMRQRVLIAIGLACRPRFLIADEPTSALDVTVQAKVLDKLAELTSEFGTSVLFITHDLALAADRADRVVVMLQGEMVESGPVHQVLTYPQHDYTKKLLHYAPNFTTEVLVEKAADAAAPPETILSLRGATMTYRNRGAKRGAPRHFTAVDAVDLDVTRGQTVAIVGESGSGKSTTAKMILRLERPTAGSVLFEGQDITNAQGRRLFDYRRRVQPVFQNPAGSLDPAITIADSIMEPLRIHRVGSGETRRARVDELLDAVSLPRAMGARLPSELSGGQRQRVAIARALALRPDVIVLDEAVSALDVVVQAQVLELLVELQKELGLSYLFISHDLAVVRMIAHRIHVMSRGRIVESGTSAQIFDHPQNPYTRELFASIPGRELRATVNQ
jgi:peptide/nickel transport system ATP-binding protein